MLDEKKGGLWIEWLGSLAPRDNTVGWMYECYCTALGWMVSKREREDVVEMRKTGERGNSMGKENGGDSGLCLDYGIIGIKIREREKS